MANNNVSSTSAPSAQPTEADNFYQLICLFGQRHLPLITRHVFLWRVEEIQINFYHHFQPTPPPPHFRFLHNLNRVPTDPDLRAMTILCGCPSCLRFRNSIHIESCISTSVYRRDNGQ